MTLPGETVSSQAREYPARMGGLLIAGEQSHAVKQGAKKLSMRTEANIFKRHLAMNRRVTHFSLFARTLHWLMAGMIVAMLIIGLNHNLLWMHEPLGISILLLVIVRIYVRVLGDVPPLPQDIPLVQRKAARLSHLLLYALMIAMPLIGWSMVSAEGDPIVIAGWVQLPMIMPHDIHLYHALRKAHIYLAILLAGIFAMHVAAALYHALIRRDGVFASMTSGGRRIDVDRPL
jgi:cytochrome b561